MAVTLSQRDKDILLSICGLPEVRDRIVQLLTLAGSGTVAGPDSSTDNALVRFDGTTGVLLQNSPITISDLGALTVPQISTPSNPAASNNSLYFKSDNKLYKLTSAGVESEVGASTGGDVVGPASAVDGCIANFSGITGKLLANSGVLLKSSPVGTNNTVSIYTTHVDTFPNLESVWLGKEAGKDVGSISGNSSSVGVGYRALYVLGSTGYGDGNCALGWQAGVLQTHGSSNIFIGHNSGGNAGIFGGGAVTGEGMIFLGAGSGVHGATNLNYSIALGHGAAVTANNQLVIGDDSAPINNAYFGHGVFSTTAGSAGVTFNATGGSGTNISGADFRIAAGKNTGSGTPGVIRFATGTAGASGTTLSALTDRVIITGEIFRSLSLTNRFDGDGGGYGGFTGIGTSPTFQYLLTLGGNALTTGSVDQGIIFGNTPVPTNATNSWRCIDMIVRGTGGTTADSAAFHAQLATLGGSTFTRLSNFSGVTQTIGVSNSFLSDNTTFSGNYFIHSTTTRPSLISGDLQINTAGKGLQVKEGANAKMGIATLVAGTVTVSTTAVTANSRIFLTQQNISGVSVATAVAVSARSAGVSFTISSASGSDTSTIAWTIFEPA